MSVLRRPRALVALLLAASVLATSLLAAPRPALAQTCNADTEARLEFLESHLDAGQRNEKRWWNGWMTIFVIGALFKTTEGALESDGSNAAAAYIAAGKSVLGVADLTLRPHVGRRGAEPMRAIAKTSPANCAERLALAEKTMELAANASSERWNWKTHASSFALNLAAGLAVTEGWNDPGSGWRDFGVSTVASEIHIWTHPTMAADSWPAYRAEFSGVPVARAPATFRIAAMPGGIGVRWKF